MTYLYSPFQKLVRSPLTVVAGTLLASGALVIALPASSLAQTLPVPIENRQVEKRQVEKRQVELKQSESNRASGPTLEGLLQTIPERVTAPPASVPEPTAPEPTTDPAAIPSGESVEQPVSLLLNLSDRRVYVYRGDTVEVSYPVAIGREGWETPTGEFEIFHQLENPGWTNPKTSEVVPPGPDNPLGDRWIAFWTDGTNSIGFHGTPNRESVGQAASHGCVRMYNEDVRQLYAMVDVGTPVTVVQ